MLREVLRMQLPAGGLVQCSGLHEALCLQAALLHVVDCRRLLDVVRLLGGTFTCPRQCRVQFDCCRPCRMLSALEALLNAFWMQEVCARRRS